MEYKKTYLNSYRLQENIIRTLNRMIIENPSKSNHFFKKIEECEKLRTEIADKIAQVDEPRLKVILYEKYINGLTLEAIAPILNYSKRHTERLHIAALKAFKI